MKKLFILALTIFTLTACSSDDDNLDPIVGSWNPFSENGIELNDCGKRTKLTFSGNGNFSAIAYFENANNECELDVTSNGTWVNDGNGIYSITTNNDTNTAQLTFSNNNNTFTSGSAVFNRVN